MIHMQELIEAKKRGDAHQPPSLRQLVRAYTAGEVPDYQMAAWLMAVRWRGLTDAETFSFTDALVASGEQLDLGAAGLREPTIDKHSTGGVGDKLSLIVVPLLVAAGATVVKLSGAGLGHTGGTVDKLRAIPGLRLELTGDEILQVARQAGGCMAAQSAELVPADGAIYALRDATATVDSLPLIAASVMAKKIACGAATIALDVKVGRGAFMRSRVEATALARLMLSIAGRFGRRAVAVLTAMDQLLGDAAGNAVEVNEAVAVMQGGGPPAVRELALVLAAHALAAAAQEDGHEAVAATRARLERLLAGGHALESFARIVKAQGGETGWIRRPVADPTGLAAPRAVRAVPAADASGGLPLAAIMAEVRAPRTGALAAVDALSVGRAAVGLGAGRSRKGEEVDPGAGVLLLVRAGDNVIAGQPVARLFTSAAGRLPAAEAMIHEALVWAGDPNAIAPTPTVQAGATGRSRSAGAGAAAAAPPGETSYLPAGAVIDWLRQTAGEELSGQ